MKKETENKREIADAILLLDKMDNDNKKLNLGYFDGWLKPITKDILYMKQHPEFKNLTDDLLLYSEQELLNFINSKDEAFRLSLLKYINGISNYYFVEEDRHKCELYRVLYNRCENATPPELKSTKEPRKFTGSKLIDIYDPEKVHREFKKELKCNYNTFKAWFVDSVICDKKMSWNYSGKKGEPNKAQLMRFLFVLCSGWEPAETNTAFKINVDSNNDRAKGLNANLLQRLEKCKVD